MNAPRPSNKERFNPKSSFPQSPSSNILFEHERISYESLGWKPNDPRVNEILAANEAAGRDLVQVEHDGIKATQNVGLLRLPGLEIQVLPKIDFDPSQPSPPRTNYPRRQEYENLAAQNLLQMLAYAEGLSVKRVQLADLQKQRLSWFELLIHLFASDLHEQVLRGPHRSYQNRSEAIPVVRGKWEISKQFVRRPYQWQTLHMSFDEFTQDNLLNRAFRLVTELLLALSRNRENQKMLTAIRAWLIDVPLDFGLSPNQLKDYTFNRLNERFETSFQLARIFLASEAQRLAGGRRKSYSFMFDMNDLFENFVLGFLERHTQAIFGELAAVIRIEAQGGPRRKYLLQGVPDGNKQIGLKPDITIFHLDGTPLLILDTKYKRLTMASRNTTLFGSDCYQALAYMTRLECPRAVLLYPQVGEDRAFQKDFQVTDTGMDLVIAKIDIQQPISEPNQIIEKLTAIIKPRLGKV